MPLVIKNTRSKNFFTSIQAGCFESVAVSDDLNARFDAKRAFYY